MIYTIRLAKYLQCIDLTAILWICRSHQPYPRKCTYISYIFSLPMYKQKRRFSLTRSQGPEEIEIIDLVSSWRWCILGGIIVASAFLSMCM